MLFMLLERGKYLYNQFPPNEKHMYCVHWASTQPWWLLLCKAFTVFSGGRMADYNLY